MTVRLGSTHPLRRARGRAPRVVSRGVAIVVGAALVALAPAGFMPSRSAAASSVIVRGLAGGGVAARRAVAAVGGRVVRSLDLIDGLEAMVPGDRLADLDRSPGIASVTPNEALHLSGLGDSTSGGAASMAQVNAAIGATNLWNQHVTGAGIDVALIDSGVVPVGGLTVAGKVVNGPDLSFDAQAGAPPYLDLFGHGTHLAGIIAGRDASFRPGDTAGAGAFAGVAPGARIISVKVASAGGETDVSQVIAAIDWVVQRGHSDGLNIRVLNLSFGTDSAQDYMTDPIAYAVEVAWRKGIVVVTAGGNGGGVRDRLTDPAIDPFVIAVGAADMRGTSDTRDDVVPAWSSPGDANRRIDLVAPGVGVGSLRVPGSIIDQAAPSATGSRFLRGSGTSQAAAVVSGAVALLLDDRPQLTPDQVKALLMRTASPLPLADPADQGAGIIDLEAAHEASPPAAVQRWPLATGTGSLDAARGSVRIALGGAVLDGERDIFGMPWDGPTWARLALAGSSWRNGTWNGSAWSGGCLCASSWSGGAWAGLTWSGLTWSGLTWSGLTWSGLTWSGLTWSGLTWSGLTWSGLTWSGLTWSGLTWSGLSATGSPWTGLSWSGSAWSTSGWGDG